MDIRRLAQFRSPDARKRLLAGGAVLVLLVGASLVALSRGPAEPKAAGVQKRAAGAKGAGTETVADEKLHLTAGQFKAYPMHLAAQRNVSVRVETTPNKPVNVALVQKVRFERFRSDHGALFADKTQLVGALSGQRVVKGSPHARVPAGDWVLVVERPKDAEESAGEAGVSLRVTTASVAAAP
ncbi:MAG: hypothetical protein NVS2B9_11270 [Myxococcales bacterium]